jgi:hypothetical protein
MPTKPSPLALKLFSNFARTKPARLPIEFAFLLLPFHLGLQTGGGGGWGGKHRNEMKEYLQVTSNESTCAKISLGE